MPVKLLLVVLFVCSFQQEAAAQKVDSSFRSSYYEQKTSLFRKLPKTKGSIIFLGNSLTDIAEWSELWQNPKVKNRGISTDNTFGVLARLEEMLEEQPSKIFLMIGINDIARGIPDSLIVNNYRRIIATVQRLSPKTKLYIQSLLPTNNSFVEYRGYQNKDNHIQAVNRELAALCTGTNPVFVDLYPHFLDGEGKLDRRFTNDGLHLTVEGYLLWKRLLITKGYMK
jgi:lysophospholipase L1-like esterase